MGWTAEPGPPKPEPTPELAAALLQFQRNFNERFDASIAEDGSVGPETRGAYGHVFQQLLADYVGGESALETLRSAAGLQTRAVVMPAAARHPARAPQAGRTLVDARVEIVLVPAALALALDAESLYDETFDFLELPLFVPEGSPVVNPRDASAQERGRTELPDERTDGTDTSDYEPIEPDDPWDFLNAVPNEWNERTENEPLPLGGESDGIV
jgi:hypothetical protein